MKTYTVIPPMRGSNQTNRWLCEVRNGGFIADWRHFVTEEDAKKWGDQHDGSIKIKGANAIAGMVKRWANK